MKIYGSIALLAFVATAAGCTSYGSIPNQSTAADLRAALGQPADVRRDGGDELWDYVTGPMGTATWRYRVGPDGKVKERTQLISQERFLQVQPGVTNKDAVLMLLGRPAKQTMLRNGEVWEWRMEQGPSFGHYAVRFAPGTDVAAERIVVYDRSDDSRDRDSR